MGKPLTYAKGEQHERMHFTIMQAEGEIEQGAAVCHPWHRITSGQDVIHAGMASRATLRFGFLL